MDLVDRLIARARKMRPVYGDGVFIISNETGKWMFEGREFPDLESAQEYVGGLTADGDPDSAVIINDLGMAGEIEGTDTGEWLQGIREENAEIRRREQEEEGLNRPPERDRRLV